MSKPLDYSVWDHIEISDDEDDTHPNVDTPSLFRWRHQARVERMEEAKKERDAIEKEGKVLQQKKQEVKQKLKLSEEEAAAAELSKLKLEASELEKQEAQYRKKEEELKKKERLQPWNIDTLCQDGKDKTIVNKPAPRKKEELSEDERIARMNKFIENHKKEIEKFGMFQRYEDSEQYLMDNPHLVCEDTANHLVLRCISLEVEESHELMKHVAHQTIVMQFILELAKSLDIDPRGCVKAFFARIKLAEAQYMEAFNDELNSFIGRIEARAKIRIQEAIEQYEEEERQKRLGPGGLDPVEVFESLPPEMQECFDKKDIGMLQELVSRMDKKIAEHHIKRCIDSGLWVPGGGDNAEKASEAADKGEDKEQEEEEEEIYEDAKDI